MLNSLYSGISGLRANQTYLDVIANNVSNVNTSAFKASRVTFADAMSLLKQRGFAADTDNDTIGGRNMMQVGRGTVVSSIDIINTLGTFTNTNRSLDVAIEKAGYYFMVQDTDGSVIYTRAGNFYLDNEGNLVTSFGKKVLDADGDPLKIDDPQNYTNHAINSKGELVAVDADGKLISFGTLGLAKFANEDGLERIGSNMYRTTDAVGEEILTGVSGDPGFETLLSESTLELSNVDLSQEFTNMIIAQRAYQSNARTISKSDSILEELVNLLR